MKHRLFLITLIFSLVSYNLHAFEQKIKFQDLLDDNAYFESIDYCLVRERLFNPMFDIDINLKDGKTISFHCMDKYGKGKYCCLFKINNYGLRTRVRINDKDYPTAGLNIADLSFALGKNFSNISEVINSYDEILAYVKKIAQEEVKLGVEKMKTLSFSFDESTLNVYKGYFKPSENRKVKLFVTTKFVPWEPEWVNYLPEDFWDIDTAERTPEGENYFNNGANK